MNITTPRTIIIDPTTKQENFSPMIGEKNPVSIGLWSNDPPQTGEEFKGGIEWNSLKSG